MIRAIIPDPNCSKPAYRVCPGLVLESVLPRVYKTSSVHPRGWSRSGCWAGAWRAADRTELVGWGIHPRVHFIPWVRDENRRRKRAGCGLCISVCTIALLPKVVGVDLLLSHSQARNTVRGMALSSPLSVSYIGPGMNCHLLPPPLL